MTGVRVDDLCKAYSEYDPKSRRWRNEYPPEEFVKEVRVMCDFAKSSGEPEVLEDWESARLDSLDSIDRYQTFGGAAEFAKLAKKAPLTHNIQPQNTPEWTKFDWQRLYKGFKDVSLKEPPFAVKKFEIQKTAEGKDSVTFNVNKVVEVTLHADNNSDVDSIVINGKSFDQKNIFKTRFGAAIDWYLYQEQFDSRNYDLLQSLPFMDTEQRSTPWEINVFNQASARDSHTLSAFSIGSGFYLDGFGRLFNRVSTENNESRVYYAPSSIDSDSKYRFDPNSPFRNFTRILPPAPRPSPTYYYGGGCFSAATPVKTKDGVSITMGELYKLHEEGGILPEVASFNPEDNTITYQRPSDVKRSYVNNAGMKFLIYEVPDAKAKKAYVEVTGNHFVWIREQNGREVWRAVTEIISGDELLVAEGGKRRFTQVISNDEADNFANSTKEWVKKNPKLTTPSFDFDDIRERPAEGELDVYDLVFKNGAKVFHNYAVCPKDSKTCVVAHNK